MYKIFIRPILFLFPPEWVHELIIITLKIIFRIPGIKYIVKKLFFYESPALKLQLNNLVFRNRVGLAAGFDKNADFFDEFSAFGFSFIEIGTVTPKPQNGNARPRLFRLVKDNALINRMGFNNLGVHQAESNIKSKKPGNEGLVIGGNIGKNTVTPNELAADDYLYCFRVLYDQVDYFAINVSCPNISGMHQLQDTESLRIIIRMIVSERKQRPVFKPVFIKISPDLTFDQIGEIIDLCMEYAVDGIIATNTTSQRYNLSTTNEIISRLGSGGLSGKPLRDRSTEIIRFIHGRTGGKLPLIGVGGIISVEDALEKIKAGAWLLQIYTGFIYQGPFLARRINKKIDDYLRHSLTSQA
jgi:dihydroorotate dehydrogenase